MAREKMPRVDQVKALENYRIWLHFDDGLSGEADLSHLKGKGVFKAWNNYDAFRAVFVDPESKTAAWPGEIDLCPDVLYSEVSGIPIEQLMGLATTN